MKYKLLFLLGIISNSLFSQQADTASVAKTRKVELQLDIVSRYLWRGQCWGGDYVAVQPTVTYKGVPNWEFEFWATTNFQTEYAYSDGTVYKGYQEIDFSAAYYFKKWLFLKASDYYWPSVERVGGVDNSFFNYGKDGVKTVDLSFNLDRTEEETYPFKATISTMIAGNDFRYDSNDENPKQNFTTYLELGYMFTFLEKQEINLYVTPVVGAVLNNKAAYYTYADYDKISFCNLGVEFYKEFEIGEKGFKIPITLTYTHNAADKNTEAFGKNFLVAGLSFKY